MNKPGGKLWYYSQFALTRRVTVGKANKTLRLAYRDVRKETQFILCGSNFLVELRKVADLSSVNVTTRIPRPVKQ